MVILLDFTKTYGDFILYFSSVFLVGFHGIQRIVSSLVGMGMCQMLVPFQIG